jgi:hypothetical protein
VNGEVALNVQPAGFDQLGQAPAQETVIERESVVGRSTHRLADNSESRLPLRSAMLEQALVEMIGGSALEPAVLNDAQERTLTRECRPGFYWETARVPWLYGPVQNLREQLDRQLPKTQGRLASPTTDNWKIGNHHLGAIDADVVRKPEQGAQFVRIPRGNPDDRMLDRSCCRAKRIDGLDQPVPPVLARRVPVEPGDPITR